jgi:hypothetical protein
MAEATVAQKFNQGAFPKSGGNRFRTAFCVTFFRKKGNKENSGFVVSGYIPCCIHKSFCHAKRWNSWRRLKKIMAFVVQNTRMAHFIFLQGCQPLLRSLSLSMPLSKVGNLKIEQHTSPRPVLFHLSFFS